MSPLKAVETIAKFVNTRGKVLVIDDDTVVRRLIGGLVSEAGNSTLYEAASGSAGLAAVAELRPDLILLDIRLPDTTGYEVCASLRGDAATREIPIIMLSAAEESDAMLQALDAGADDFLRKPFFPPELKAKIQTATRLKRYRMLERERDRLRWILDHSYEPMILTDAKGCLLYSNERARVAFGLTAPGVDVARAISRQYRAEPGDAWSAWRELRLPPEGRFAIFRPETEQIAAHWYEVEVQALDPYASQTLLKFSNRSSSVRHELETFAFQHLISHKLRTPLNGLTPIFAYLATSLAKPADSETAEMLKLAQASAERLEETLTGILSYHAAIFAQSSSDREINQIPVEEIVRRSAVSAGIAGKVKWEATCALLGAPHMLEIALTELFENYAKFSTARQWGLEAKLMHADENWELTLFADGPALPPEAVEQLGQPFRQLEKKFTGEVPGIGLGLATVRLLLRSAGGDIKFYNHPDRSGLVTKLVVPRSFFQATADHVEERFI